MKQCPTCERQFPDSQRYCPRDKSSLYQVRTVFAGAIIQQKYRVESVLGIGGMSTVYLVEQLISHEKMAMKVMSSDCASDKVFRKKFEDEVRIIRQLQSTLGRNIVRVEDVGETEDKLPFVVMEYVSGDPLSKLICPEGTPASRRPLEVTRALKIAIQVCDALEVAHLHYVVHRDIKPENILLTNQDGDEVVKVLDFGIAKFNYSYNPAMDRGTTLVEYAGSPHYSSPEQAAGKTGRHFDARSDLYSLGVVLYEMLTGQQPFTGASNKEILLQHLQLLPVRPDTLNPQLSRTIVALTMKSLAKSPSERFQSAAEMRESLQAALIPADDTEVRPIPSEYVLSFVSDQGTIDRTVPVADDETLASVLAEQIAALNAQGVRLKYHEPGGSVRVTSNDRELDQMAPLRRQGIRPGDILLIRSVYLQQEVELQKWIRENEVSENLLELTSEAVQACRIRYAPILRFNPALGAQVSDLEQKCRYLLPVKEAMQKGGSVAGLAAVEKLIQLNPEFEAANLLRTRAIKDLSGQITSLIENLQFDDASRLLSEIQTATGSGELFAPLTTRLQMETAPLEARLNEVTELVAQGNIERGRAILQSFRQNAQLPNGRSVTSLLEEFDTTPVWVQNLSRLVAEERWQQARSVLDERTSIFRLWPPFLSMLSTLGALDSVYEPLHSIADAENSQRLAFVLAESGIFDLRWAAAIDFESASLDSLALLAQQILLKIGLLVGAAETRQRVAEERSLRQSFIIGLRELARSDVQQARNRLGQALVADPHPELESLKGELKYV